MRVVITTKFVPDPGETTLDAIECDAYRRAMEATIAASGEPVELRWLYVNGYGEGIADVTAPPEAVITSKYENTWCWDRRCLTSQRLRAEMCSRPFRHRVLAPNLRHGNTRVAGTAVPDDVQ